MIPYIVLLLVVVIVAHRIVGRWSRRQRAALGVMGATIVSADDSRRAASTLKSRRLGLVGRPDHLLRSNGVLIPVEQKPSARKLHASHILQVAAQCLLIEEIYKVRPPYGVVVLAGGVQERVAFTPAR